MGRYFFSLLLLLQGLLINAQDAQTHINAAEQFVANGYYREAIEQYNKALELDPQLGLAYQERARAFEKLVELSDACSDYINAAVFHESPADNYLQASILFHRLLQNEKALETLEKATANRQKFYEAYILQSQIHFETGDYNAARESANNALSAKNTAQAIYLKGLAECALNNTGQAELDFEKAASSDPLLLEAFLSLAKLQLTNNKTQKAIENCKYILQNDTGNAEAYYIKSEANGALNNLDSAISDISVAISLKPQNIDYYILRGELYLRSAQFQNAINDFTLVLGYDMINAKALRYRAGTYEQIAQKEKAATDYSLLLKVLDDTDEQAILDVENKVLELNRESDKPVIKLIQPSLINDYEIKIPDTHEQVTVSGIIEDMSNIKFLKINNDTLKPNEGLAINKNFSVSLNTHGLEYLTITATDIYDNSSTSSYSVERIESNSPTIKLQAPFADSDGVLTINADEKFLYVEGRVEDQSQIKSIKIDDVNAFYAPGEINPQFTATIDINGKSGLRVVASDIYGNTVEKHYPLRTGSKITDDDSPMGKTWVVLIENSTYKSFPNLKLPARELQEMQDALARYKIDKTIVKRNLTKRELERFFSIDLRDLMRINQVNSLMIWFAGHGENIHGSGYWIPSDATLNDEFTYFNINALKASMYAYTGLTHILVVSGACQTGAGFCLAMPGNADGLECPPPELALKKSAQVFTSSTPGYATDNSLLTHSFASVLSSNENDCISIDDIAIKVHATLQKNTAQTSEFGRIPGLTDQLGTFLFVTLKQY